MGEVSFALQTKVYDNAYSCMVMAFGSQRERGHCMCEKWKGVGIGYLLGSKIVIEIMKWTVGE